MTDETLRDHYSTGYESQRLEAGASRIEFARTKELLKRFLPAAPAAVLDVGGGPGTYAAWLTDEGYDVHLVDPVVLHVDEAAALARSLERSFVVSFGDARDLPRSDASCDAVLLLGPLYHLTERDERVRALAEARRVLRPGGVVVAAAISRFASLLDGLVNGWLGDPAFDAIVERDLAGGQHRNPSERSEWFTTAFFHHPNEVRAEVEEAGLQLQALIGIEGPGWLLGERWDDPEGRENILRVARALEEEDSALGVSSHLLGIARKQPPPPRGFARGPSSPSV